MIAFHILYLHIKRVLYRVYFEMVEETNYNLDTSEVVVVLDLVSALIDIQHVYIQLTSVPISYGTYVWLKLYSILFPH